jgi:hypothetical protein
MKVQPLCFEPFGSDPPRVSGIRSTRKINLLPNPGQGTRQPERRLIIEQVAARKGILPVIVEKDFWDCWVLGRIFATPAMASSVVFKGGTSLSKVFGVIERFSEDADLSVSPSSLGFADKDLDDAPSATQRSKRMKVLAEACEDCVAVRFQPALEAGIAEVIGPPFPAIVLAQL